MSDVNGRGPSLRGAIDLSGLVNRPALPADGTDAAPSGAPVAPPAPVEGRVYVGDDAGFAQFLDLSAEVPVLALLWAQWATPVAELTPVLEKVLAGFPGRFVLVTVDVDRNPQLAQAFQAQSVPMMAAVLGGRPVPLFQGAMPEEQLRELLERVLELAAQSGVTGTVGGTPADSDGETAEVAPAPLPPLHQEAYDAIDRGDYAAAIEAYRTALAQNPADADAKAGLAQVSLLHRLQGKTLDAIRNAAALSPDALDANLDVADLDVSGGHVEDAFDRLLTLFPKLDAEGKGIVRERLVELFEIVGPEDPRVSVARRRLTNLLY